MNKWNKHDNVEVPVEKEVPGYGSRGCDTKTTVTHPAFGQISISRINGAKILYGSEFMHHNWIELRIKKSEYDRDLCSEWPHEREELIGVSLSEAQWATLISSLNMGSGVRCTLEHIQGQPLPGLPEPTRPQDHFANDIVKMQHDAFKELDALESMVKEMNLPKGKTDQILSRVRHAKMELGPNTKFVAEQFDRHMEKTVEKAKVEINAHLEVLALKHGLPELQAKGLSLGYQPDKQDDN